MRRPLLLTLLLSLPGCVEDIAPPQPPQPQEQAAAEAVVSTGGDGSEASAALGDGAMERALGEELGQPVSSSPGAALTMEITRDRRLARLVFRAPDRLAALAGCKAWLRLARARDEARAIRDPAEVFFRGEVARLEREIATLDRQLRVLPASPWDEPRSRDEALVTARTRRLEASVRRARDEGQGSASFPLGGALDRLATDARREAAEARASGLGPAHPTVQAIEARAAFYEARQKAQWAIEEEAARAVEDALAALPAKADAVAVRRVTAPLVRRSTIDRCSAQDPRPLQILALEQMVLLAAGEEDKIHYGKNHPQRLARAARVAEQEAAFNTERDMEASLLEHGAPAGGDLRPGDLRDKAASLASTLARLIQRHDEAGPPRAAQLTIETPCHLR